jgi:hypothetical protein
VAVGSGLMLCKVGKKLQQMNPGLFV